jgi:hypothetical protein
VLLAGTCVCRYPVLVDPQGQGRLWIMNREEANQLKVTQLNDKMFRNHLEDCLAFGKVRTVVCCKGVLQRLDCCASASY